MFSPSTHQPREADHSSNSFYTLASIGDILRTVLGVVLGGGGSCRSKEPEFTIGIEEEYHVVDLETRDLAQDPPAAFMEKCEARMGGQVTGEFLRSQIEIGTTVCKTAREAGAQLERASSVYCGCRTGIRGLRRWQRPRIRLRIGRSSPIRIRNAAARWPMIFRWWRGGC